MLVVIVTLVSTRLELGWVEMDRTGDPRFVFMFRSIVLPPNLPLFPLKKKRKIYKNLLEINLRYLLNPPEVWSRLQKIRLWGVNPLRPSLYLRINRTQLSLLQPSESFLKIHYSSLVTSWYPTSQPWSIHPVHSIFRVGLRDVTPPPRFNPWIGYTPAIRAATWTISGEKLKPVYFFHQEI